MLFRKKPAALEPAHIEAQTDRAQTKRATEAMKVELEQTTQRVEAVLMRLRRKGEEVERRTIVRLVKVRS